MLIFNSFVWILAVANIHAHFQFYILDEKEILRFRLSPKNPAGNFPLIICSSHEKVDMATPKKEKKMVEKRY